MSPLTRYISEDDNKLSLIAISKGKAWKVVLSGNRKGDKYHPGPLICFTDFCRIVSRAGIRSLEVALIPIGIEYDGSFASLLWYSYNMRSILDPVGLFRNLSRVVIRDATLAELPDDLSRHRCNSHRTHHSLLVGQSALVQTATALTTGSSPVECMLEMYNDLLKYAQAFERFELFKECMVSGRKYLDLRTWGEKLDYETKVVSLEAKRYI